MADTFDADMIILAHLERTLRGGVERCGIEPAAPAFVVDTARPVAGGGIYLRLAAVHQAFSFVACGVIVASYLDARIGGGIRYADVHLQGKVGVFLFRDEKG